MNKAIKKIELDLGGKTVSLTPQQAKNLKDALDDLFGKEIIKVIEKEYIRDLYPIPYPAPYRPCWEYQPHYYDRITCDANTSAVNTFSDTGTYSFDNDTLRLTG